jgi:outer membrane protein insertion porin family
MFEVLITMELDHIVKVRSIVLVVLWKNVFFCYLGAALGGDCYWATGIHLYTPLPFLYHRENLMSYVRLHYFLNAGNVFNIQSVRKYLNNSFFKINISYSDSPQTLFSQLTNATRLSCGLGVVLNLMNVARLELNYSLPLWTQVHDRLDFIQIKIL